MRANTYEAANVCVFRFFQSARFGVSQLLRRRRPLVSPSAAFRPFLGRAVLAAQSTSRRVARCRVVQCSGASSTELYVQHSSSRERERERGEHTWEKERNKDRGPTERETDRQSSVSFLPSFSPLARLFFFFRVARLFFPG